MRRKINNIVPIDNPWSEFNKQTIENSHNTHNFIILKEEFSYNQVAPIPCLEGIRSTSSQGQTVNNTQIYMANLRPKMKGK